MTIADLLASDIVALSRSYEAKMRRASFWQQMADTLERDISVINPAEWRDAQAARLEVIVAYCLHDAERDRVNLEASRAELERVAS